MGTVEEIQSAIQSLPHDEYMRLVTWMHEKDWENWDQQLEKDAASGKLDFLLAEVDEAKKEGKLEEL